MVKGVESGSTGVDLGTVFLVAFKESLGPGDVVGQFLAADQLVHGRDPLHQIAVVRKEPLVIVGVEELLLSVVGLGRQTVPLLVEFPLEIVDLLSSLRVALSQLVGLLIQALDLVSQGGEIPLDTVMLPLESLNGTKIAPKVFGVKGIVLLLDPVAGLVDVAVEALNFVSRSELLFALLGLLLESLPASIEILDLLTDSNGGLGLSNGSKGSG